MAAHLMRRLGLLFVALAGLYASPALAQATYPTPAGSRVQGTVPLQCDTSGANCVPAGSTAASANKVQGTSASSATDDGTNPVKMGGIYQTTPPTLTNGQRGTAQLGVAGGQKMQLMVPDTNFAFDTSAGNNDGAGAVVNGLLVGSYNRVFNGTGWDRARGDTTGTYVVEVPSASVNAGVAVNATTVASSALVAKASAGNLYGYNVVSGASAGYLLIFNATAAPADGTVTPARCIPLAANTGLDVDMRGQPTYFATGITLVFSTTGCFTKTASATAFIAADVR